MRKHKFRGLSIRFDEGWVTGDVLYGKDFRTAHIYKVPGSRISIPVVVESIGLSTKKHDNKGREIFNGDLVRFQVGEFGGIGEVRQLPSGEWVLWKSEQKHISLYLALGHVEVVGNVSERHLVEKDDQCEANTITGEE